MNYRWQSLLFATMVFVIVSFSFAYAADPGHGAAAIGSGSFESGNYIFPANLNVSFNFTVGGTTFFINNNTQRVGIGTITPTHTLNVVGGANITTNLTVAENLFVNSSRVGIGTVAPTQLLDVRGHVNVSGELYVKNATAVSPWLYNQTGFSTTYNATYASWAYNQSNWNVSGTNIFPRDTSLNVSIGTTSSSEKLTVAGNTNIQGNLWFDKLLESSNTQFQRAHHEIGGRSKGDTWTEAGTDALPVATYYHSSLVYDGKMWVIGGDNDTISGARKVYSSTDGITWTEAGTDALPVATYIHSSLVYDGKMWVIGGYNSSTNVRTVYSSTNGTTWTEAGTDALPVATYYHSSLVYDGKMWVIGGYTTSAVRKVYSSTDGITWTEAGTDALPAATYSHSSLVYDGKMWVIGGFTTTEVRKVYYSTNGTTWTEAGTNALPVATYQHSSLVYDGKMWVIGGDNDTISGASKVYYSTNGTTWTEAGTNALPVATYFHSSLVYDGKMWVIGGYTTSAVRKVYYTSPTIKGGLTVTDSIDAELVRITNAGNVGIGTTVPTAKLHVNGTGALLNVSNTTASMLYASGSTGNVGIGTVAPTQLLDVRGHVNVSGELYVKNATAVSPWLYNQTGFSTTYNATYAGFAYNQSNWNTTATTIFPRDISLNVSIGTNTAPYLLTVLANNSGINTTTIVLSLEHFATNGNTNGTAGIGTAILFRASDSIAEMENISMIIANLTTATNGNEAGVLQFLTRTGGGSLTERLRIDDAGNVGIGTTSPETLLHVQSLDNTDPVLITILKTVNSAANGIVLRVENSGGAGGTGLGTRLQFEGETTTTIGQDMAQIGALWTDGAHATRTGALTFFTVNNAGALTERARILGNGNVGIGTSVPTAKLHVNGTGALLNVSNTTASMLYASGSTGNVGIGTTSPTQLLDVRGHVNVSGELYVKNATAVSPWLYNQTGFSTTYNATYASWAYNQTGFSTTYNATYAGWAYNQTGFSTTYNATYAGWAYNQTGFSTTYNATYAGWAYNQTGFSTTYNATYAGWAYNQTGFSTTYNATYAGFAYNQSNWNFSSSVFFLRDTAGRVSIGGTTSNYKLNVAGNVSLNSTLFVTAASRVGVGTTTPSHNLNVVGSANITGSLIINNIGTNVTANVTCVIIKGSTSTMEIC